MSLFNQVLSTADVKIFKATQAALWIPAYRQLAYRQLQMALNLLCMKPSMCTTQPYAQTSKIVFLLRVIPAYRQFDCRYAEESQQ